MKPTPALLALLALTLVGPPLRAQDEKLAPLPETESTVPDLEPETPLKKERPRRPEGAPDRPAPRPRPDRGHVERPAARAEVPSSKRTWMGISTQPVDPSLREHLEISEGFGIQVVEVMPESPAAQAGLRNNDIVLRFGDQRLISPEHLSLLVREKSNGEQADLTVIRKGREEKVTVTLGEAEDNLFGPFGESSDRPEGFFTPPQWQENRRRAQDEILRQQQDYWQDWMEKNQAHGRGENSPNPEGQSPNPDRYQRVPMPPKGRPPGVSVNPGFPLRVFGTEGVLNIDNEQGELTLTRKDEQHHLLIKDAEGRQVYEGPFDPVKGVSGLPQEAREQLEAMKLGNLEIRLPDPPQETPEKTVEPREERSREAESADGIL